MHRKQKDYVNERPDLEVSRGVNTEGGVKAIRRSREAVQTLCWMYSSHFPEGTTNEVLLNNVSSPLTQ